MDRPGGTLSAELCQPGAGGDVIRKEPLLLLSFYAFLKKFNFIYLLWAAMGLHCCTGFSLVTASGGYSLGAVYGHLMLWIVGCEARGPQ